MGKSIFRGLLAGLFALGVAPAGAWAFGSGMKIWLPEGITTLSGTIDKLFYIVLGLTGAVFILVQGVLLFFLIKYRKRSGQKAHYIHGNAMAEIIWTAVPTAILVWLAFYNQAIWAKLRGTPPPPDLEVEVTAEQFAWNIRYAGPDNALNTADDILTLNQFHLPVDKTVLIHLKSKDVIHSFFVPQFRFKQDAVPGITGRLWVQPTRTGNYEIACAELCGLGHYRMRGYLSVEPADAFGAWLVEQAAEQNT